MTTSEFRKLITKIQAAYPRQKIPQETVEVWYEELKRCEYHKVKKRAVTHLREKPYIPNLNDLYVAFEEETTILQTIRAWEKEGAKRIEKEKRNKRPIPAPPWAR